MSKGPDFIGIGVGKSGTTWVAARLAEHPQVCLPKKETRFWTRNFHRGYGWYHKYFKDREGRIAGEFSTDYIITPRPPHWRLECYPRRSLGTFIRHIIRRHLSARDEIKKMYPEIKILAVFRNPVERAWSRYWMWVEHRKKRGKAHLVVPFEKMFRDDGRWMRTIGCYATLLRHWREAFPNMGVFLYDDIVADPIEFMASVYRFLGVDDSFVGDLERRENARKYEPIDPASRRLALEFFEPEIREFSKLIGRNLDHWLEQGV